MLSYQDSAPSITSKSTRQSVYQTNGRPLSEEAIYKAKLKYGIYNNPAKVNLGVDPSASDTAALLASSSDLSIHPYKRELSTEAATAALIAKTDSAPSAWKRNNFAPEAEYAAISAKSQKYPFYEEDVESSEFVESQDAAASVLKKPSNAPAKSALQELYDFDDVRSGRATISNLQAGATGSGGAYEASKVINIARILNKATDSATKTLDSRVNPQVLDARSGLATANAHAEANGAVDISKITSSAQKSALKSMTSRLNPSREGLYGLPTASDSQDNAKFASVGALASQNFDPKTDYAAAERATLARNSLIDNKVLIKAISNANSTLDRIDNKAVQDNLFGNKEWNIKAVQIAQANFAKRKSETVGKIDVGGGLLLDISQINQMASSVVQPILSDLDAKVEQQKAFNQAAKQQKEERKQKQAEFFAAQKQAKIEAKQKREAEKVARRQKLQADKDKLKEEQAAMKAEKEAALEAKKQAFKDQIAAEEEAKHEVDTEREEKLAELKKVKAEKDAVRQAEIDEIQAEKDKEVAPLVAEADQETTLWNELKAKREEADAFHAEHKTRHEVGSAKLESTLSKLERIGEKIAAAEAALAAATTDSERLAAESDLVHEQAELDYEQKQREYDEFVANRSKLSDTKEELESHRKELIAELKEIKTSVKKEQKEINASLPEHLQKEIDSDISDEETIDHSPFELDDSSITEPPAVEVEEPEKEPVDYGYDEEAEAKKVADVAAKSQAKPEAKSEQESGEKTTAEPYVSVPKKTWEEIKASGNFGPGEDPLASVATNEKPPMASVVTDNEVTAAQNRALTQSDDVAPAKGASSAANARTKAAGKAVKPEETKQEKKEGLGKRFIKFLATEPPKPKKKVKEAPKPTPKKEAPVEETPAADAFSNFSQGSDVAAK
ncbi:hypothetical protein OGAPHI_000799 [Ogataea philodendri]|uniref:Eisosome protein 1 n=1 Tax=Ogataea philodendri TaxID=1378263 RepID=A0A9P8T985_9ASCO|nr:uncharacterized protein OGAPHI_000799 [Ogataea philodendri]KAH3671088.1 hypothetical protein OGAPHI_000799 [Ogataea philodendri]